MKFFSLNEKVVVMWRKEILYYFRESIIKDSIGFEKVFNKVLGNILFFYLEV